VDQAQGLRGEEQDAGRRIAAAGEDVDDDGRGEHPVVQGFAAGRFDGRQPVFGDTSEDGNHLPVTVVEPLQLASDRSHRWRQDPIPEWGAIAQGAGFACQDRDIVPRIIDRLAAPKAAWVLADDGLAAVEAACREALDHGVHSAPVVINILARRRDPAPAPMLLTPAALRLTHEPAADCTLYDSLRRTSRHGTHPNPRPDEHPEALRDAQRL
jgi:hypothetical protein